MPTWGELREYARSKYKLADDEERWFSVVFAFQDGRSQKNCVRAFDAFEKEWVEFSTVVCKLEEMAPKVALRKNHQFVVGTLALDKDDDYLLIHAAPLDTMDPSEFELPLQALARSADLLEKECSAGNDDY
jgi:hypothetical protein